jgi:signal transduction histidine kinase
VFAALTIEVLTSAKQEGSALLNILGCALIAAPLLFCRRAPLAAAAGVFTAAALHSLVLTPMSALVTSIALLIAPAYSVAAYLPRREALAGLAICIAGTLAIEPSPPAALIAVLAFAAGRAMRDRSERAAQLAALNAELERTRDAHAARARGEERLRIARELHDAVAHAMTVIVLQAGAAQRVWGSDPAAARVAVDALGGVARDTLAELRVSLRGAATVSDDALDELVERVRPVGVDVIVERDADPDHVALMVIQEALTNAARHAAPTTVRVAIRTDGGDLVVEVADRGRTPGAAPPAQVLGTGTGLRGMAERVEAAGGTLRYGGDGPGFIVEARMPLREAVTA